MRIRLSVVYMCVLSVSAQTVLKEHILATPRVLEQNENEIGDALAKLDSEDQGVERIRQALREVVSMSSQTITDSDERAAASERILRMRLRIWAGVQEALLKLESEMDTGLTPATKVPEPLNVNGVDSYVDMNGNLVVGDKAWQVYERDVTENRKQLELVERKQALSLVCVEARGHAMRVTVPYLRNAAEREKVYEIIVKEVKDERVRGLYLEELARRNRPARELLEKERAGARLRAEDADPR
ncbi:MAG: hypothetical protein H7A45_04750 [Verrucomicrobiales bacterium]|nr:hypothetical protein [Verrucomicrobiales bacterium]